VAAAWRPGTDQNAHTGFPGNIPLYSFAKDDGFSLNAVDIALDKPMDESPWASGYHFEMMFGPDSEPSSNAGFTGARVLGFGSIRQAYVALRTPVGNSSIDWKVGVFDTVIGYESNSDGLNPNYTRSYGYTIEPTTHTGVVGTYKVNDMVSVTAGIADSANADNNSFNGINNTSVYESQKTYMGAIAITAPDSAGWLKGATLNAGVVDSIDSNNSFGQGSATSWYAGATIPTPVSALKTGASFDYLDLHSGVGEAWNVALYASWQINDKASFNLRAEMAQDDAGVLYGGFNIPGGGVRNTADEFTATLQYNLWANVLSRLEFRWDHVEHGQAFGVVSSSSGTPGRSNDFLLALNLIYQF